MFRLSVSRPAAFPAESVTENPSSARRYTAKKSSSTIAVVTPSTERVIFGATETERLPRENSHREVRGVCTCVCFFLYDVRPVQNGRRVPPRVHHDAYLFRVRIHTVPATRTFPRPPPEVGTRQRRAPGTPPPIRTTRGHRYLRRRRGR